MLKALRLPDASHSINGYSCSHFALGRRYRTCVQLSVSNSFKRQVIQRGV